MAGKNWKKGYVPAHERMTVGEQVASMLDHVDALTARSKALANAEKRRRILDTYPRNPPSMNTLHGIALAYDYWRDVAALLLAALEGRTLIIMDECGDVDERRVFAR